MINRIKFILIKYKILHDSCQVIIKKPLKAEKELIVNNNLTPIQEKKACVKTNTEKFKPSESPSGC